MVPPPTRRAVVAEHKRDNELIQTFNLVDNDVEAERAWEQFAPQCLKWAPSAAELLKRWHRHRFTKFIRQEFIGRKQKPPSPIGSEEIFFKLYPYLKTKWMAEKKKGETIQPTSSLLLDRWFTQRKYEYKKNWLKKNRSGDRYNFRNQKIVSANRGSFCNYRPRMYRFQLWFNNFAIISILLLLIVILFRKEFKPF